MKNLKTHLKNSLVHSLISRWENWVLNRSCYSPTQRLPRGDLRCTVQPFYLAWQPFFFFLRMLHSYSQKSTLNWYFPKARLFLVNCLFLICWLHLESHTWENYQKGKILFPWTFPCFMTQESLLGLWLQVVKFCFTLMSSFFKWVSCDNIKTAIRYHFT